MAILLWYYNLTSGSFLKISYGVEPGTCQWPFHNSVKLKPIIHSCTLNRSFTHAWFCNIMHWSFERYRFTELCRSCQILTFHYIISHNHVKTSTDLIRKVFKYWEASSSLCLCIQVFKILIVIWKFEFYHWQILSIVFLEVMGWLHFWENVF